MCNFSDKSDSSIPSHLITFRKLGSYKKEKFKKSDKKKVE